MSVQKFKRPEWVTDEMADEMAAAFAACCAEAGFPTTPRREADPARHAGFPGVPLHVADKARQLVFAKYGVPLIPVDGYGEAAS